MADARSRWWSHRDTRRVLARAEATSGTVTSTDELVYMRGFTQLLLAEVLPLDVGDRERLRLLYHELDRTLAERTVAPNGRETGQEGARTE